MTSSLTCHKCGTRFGWFIDDPQNTKLRAAHLSHKEQCDGLDELYTDPFFKEEKQMAKHDEDVAPVTKTAAIDYKAKYEELLAHVNTFSEAFRTHGAGAQTQEAGLALLTWLGHVRVGQAPPVDFDQKTGNPI